LAKEQLIWFIKKGDVILSDQPRVVKKWFSINFLATGPRMGRVPIYTYDDDDIPDRFSNAENDLSLLYALEYDLTEFPLDEFTRRQPRGTKVPFYVASLSLTMSLSLEMLQIELCWKERTLDRAEIL